MQTVQRHKVKELCESLLWGMIVGGITTYLVLGMLQRQRVVLVQVPRERLCFVSEKQLPVYFKWKESLLVPARSQKGCAACWSFSVVDMMADTLNLRSGGAWKRQPLSAQYLLSCSFAHQGCGVGGSPEDVYNLPQMTQLGVPLDRDMPYQMKVGACTRLPTNLLRIQTVAGSAIDLCTDPALVLPGFRAAAIRRNVTNMKRALLTYGPILGTLRVNADLYQYTGDSVYHLDTASPFVGMHAICIVGWCDAGCSPHAGEHFQEPYWVIRSSWGTRWGKRGFGYVRMGSNEADIESRASVCQVQVPHFLQAAIAAHSIEQSAFFCTQGGCSSDPERAEVHATGKIL